MKFFRKKTTSIPYRVGNYTIELPPDHNLPRFQEKFKRYDRPLAEIARRLAKKYTHFISIDIGANVGDSAAILRSETDSPLLCIEGHPSFLPFLKKNLPLMGAGIALEEAFVGSDREGLLPVFSPAVGGTASLRHFPSLPTYSLKTILAKHPSFYSFQFLKIDTDGFDFPILLHSKEEIARELPVIFFEYDIHFNPEGEREGIEVIEFLNSLGYSFQVYDNFGHPFITLEANVNKKMEELNRYLRSHRLYGTAIYYYDICAFPAKDNDLLKSICFF